MAGRQLFAAVLLGAVPALGVAADLSALVPSTLFAQAGVGDQDTHAYVLGGTWDWPWQQHWRYATLSGYFEADVGRWTSDVNGQERTVYTTQAGLTPVLRVRPSGRASPWFAEAGVGANLILPLFHSGDKSFSTEFNFGDHFALGRDFGSRGQHELALRIEHFSNAGINHPNPGENFGQVRYSWRF